MEDLVVIKEPSFAGAMQYHFGQGYPFNNPKLILFFLHIIAAAYHAKLMSILQDWNKSMHSKNTLKVSMIV